MRQKFRCNFRFQGAYCGLYAPESVVLIMIIIFARSTSYSRFNNAAHTCINSNHRSEFAEGLGGAAARRVG